MQLPQFVQSFSRKLGLKSLPMMIASLGFVGALAGMPAAHAAPVASANGVVAAYAIVLGDESAAGSADHIPLPKRSVYNSTGGGATVEHYSVGRYIVRIAGLGLVPDSPGVVHVRSTSAGGSFCASQGTNTVSSVDLIADIQCWSATGQDTDSGFSVSYTRGGTEQGKLITAQIERAGSDVVVPYFESSVGGTVTAKRTAPGEYLVTTPDLTGSGPMTIEVTQSENQPQVCGVPSTSVENGKRLIKVACNDRGSGSPNTSFHLTYAKGVNVLGKKQLSDAYFTTSKMTTNTTISLTPSTVLNSIYGQNGAVTMTRLGAGLYELRLQYQHQGLDRGMMHITTRNGLVSCAAVNTFTTPTKTYKSVQVFCNGPSGAPSDTPLQVVYLTRE